MKNILITGGAGYLGLNIAIPLLETGNTVIIVDDLKNSYVCHVKNLIKTFPKNTVFYKGDVCDYNFMKQIFHAHKPDIILHLSALKYVGESIKKPDKYLKNNIDSLETVLKLTDEFKAKRIAFASSAVVYGNAQYADETCPFSPLSPYAQTKANGEKLILDWSVKTKIPSTIFRFSNPIGANTKFMFGDHSKKGVLNLVPYIVKNAIQDTPMTFKGNDHPTPDGTPIRDYIFVSDLSKIVSKVLLTSTSKQEILNVSSGSGFSVLEIIKTTEKLLNKKLNFSFSERNKNEASISILKCDLLNSKYALKTTAKLEQIIQSQIDFCKFYIEKTE